jgi:hypothetical protein
MQDTMLLFGTPLYDECFHLQIKEKHESFNNLVVIDYIKIVYCQNVFQATKSLNIDYFT